MPSLHPYAWTLLLLCLTGTAAVTDARRGLIPNWLTLPALASFPLAQLTSAGPGGLRDACLGVVACSLVPLLLFRAGAMGGGDVKLFAAIGAWCGSSLGLELQLVSYCLAAVFALCVLAYRGALLATLLRALALLCGPLLPARLRATAQPEQPMQVRLGVAIFAATLLLIGPAMLGAQP